jgi:hypothetical protein
MLMSIGYFATVVYTIIWLRFNRCNRTAYVTFSGKETIEVIC